MAVTVQKVPVPDEVDAYGEALARLIEKLERMVPRELTIGDELEADARGEELPRLSPVEYLLLMGVANETIDAVDTLRDQAEQIQKLLTYEIGNAAGYGAFLAGDR
jgi:hypothetical protein